MGCVKSAGLGLRCSVVVGVLAACATSAAAQPAAKSGSGSLAGMWNNTVAVMPIKAGPVVKGAPTFLTADGQAIPLLPAAAKVVAERLADKDFVTNTDVCNTEGMPTVAFSPPQYKLQILDHPEQVSVLFEQSLNYRMIRMEPHPEDPNEAFMGESSGKWQGDTLVVDTVAMIEDTNILAVIPHSDQLHVVERMRRTGPDTFEDQVTMEDPMTFSKKWTLVAKYKKSPATQITAIPCKPKVAPKDLGTQAATVAR